jgi:hypothetical protein
VRDREGEERSGVYRCGCEEPIVLNIHLAAGATFVAYSGGTLSGSVKLGEYGAATFAAVKA